MLIQFPWQTQNGFKQIVPVDCENHKKNKQRVGELQGL